MFTGKTVFAQLMSLIPRRDFNACVARYNGDYRSRDLSCYDQFLVMCLAQYASKNSLQDNEASLIAVDHKLYHSGISYAVPRNALSKANEQRDWRIYRDFGQALIKRVRPLYTEDPFRLFSHIHKNGAFFLTRAKNNMLYEVVESRGCDPEAGIIGDEIIRLTGVKPSKCYPENLRMVTYEDFATGKSYRFLTNHLGYEALTIAELYRERWNVELFFKWIKQHLHIKSFYGHLGECCDYITLNVPPGTFSNVPLRIWSLSVRQSYYYFCFFLLIESPFSSTRTALAVRRSMIASAKVGSLI